MATSRGLRRMKDKRDLHVEVQGDDIRRHPPRHELRGEILQGNGLPSATSYQIPFRPRGSGYPDDASRVSYPRLEGRQRQSARAGVDCVGLTRSPDRNRLHPTDRIAFRAEAFCSSSVTLAARALSQCFLLIDRSSDAGAPPSLSQRSKALALLFGRLGCAVMRICAVNLPDSSAN